MTSFPAQARRVRDSGLTPHRRMLALRECVVHFGPYGFRATWHHLLVTARVPRLLDNDPASLVRAVSELEQARRLWADRRDDFAERRRREKAAGRRATQRSERWLSWAGWLAYCPDPLQHPHEHLAVVVQRVIDAYTSGADWSTHCPVCGQIRAATESCPRCGVAPPGLTIVPPANLRHRIEQDWRKIWQRTAYIEA